MPNPGYTSGPVVLTDETGSSILKRAAGEAYASDDTGATWRALKQTQRPTSFAEETLLLAQYLMPDRGFNRMLGTDLLQLTDVALSAAGPPVLDTTAPVFSGGVVKFSGTAGFFGLNPTTPGATTYQSILGAFDSAASPWLLRGRGLLNFVTFTAATSVVLLSLDNGDGSGAAPTQYVQLCSNGSGVNGAQQLFIRMNVGAGNVDVSCGPDGVLGGASSLVPVNRMFEYLLGFDGGSVFWAFRDQVKPANRLSALSMVAPNMDAMPLDARFVTVRNTDTTNGANIYVDAVAIAYCATMGNK